MSGPLLQVNAEEVEEEVRYSICVMMVTGGKPATPSHYPLLIPHTAPATMMAANNNRI